MVFSVMGPTSYVGMTFRSGSLRYSQYTLDVYLREDNESLHTKRFDAMPFNSDAKTINDVRNELDRDIVLVAWS